ncbi:DUF302 domain-containing protein [Salinicola sp. JS01]|uniref:DUF302 domain-containing protein n=1 Tax=Salinicola sp. JS01 TaxID=3050071 RepID=UPI00255BAC57|nr:DUF302 domain-containing protein [Salinicola sp. JS01]WIX32628.1 DUF302 domain-containing protein [Salinicola sp. JS01]
MISIPDRIRRWTLALMLMMVVSPGMAQTRWPENGWQVISTQQSYTTLLSHLKSAVTDNGMGIVTDVGPTQVAAQRGVKIPGNRVIGVFRNDLAVEILRLSVPAMIEAPIRFYVTENDDGTATLSWKKPSAIFAPYVAELDDDERAAALADKARELDALFARIAEDATQR